MSADNTGDYVPYDERDLTYFGARAVVEREFGDIRALRHARDLVYGPRKAEPPRDPGTPAQQPVQYRATHGQGQRHFGFAPRSMRGHRRVRPPKDLVGLALSGGGIRSASFCLGILQGLADNGCLAEVDYLSTVSGGGYIGSALTWALHRSWTLEDAAGARLAWGTRASHRAQAAADTLRFGLVGDEFPFRSYPIADTERRRAAPAVFAPRPQLSYPATLHGRLLRGLRQSSDYLLPGRGLDLMALSMVVLRTTLYSLGIYFTGAVLTLLELPRRGTAGGTAHTLDASMPDQALLRWAAWLIVLFGVSIPVYSLSTYALTRNTLTARLLSTISSSVIAVWRCWFGLAAGGPQRQGRAIDARGGWLTSYDWRRFCDVVLGRWLKLLCVTVLFGVVPVLPALTAGVVQLYHTLTQQPGGVAAIASVAGYLAAMVTFIRTLTPGYSRLLTSMLAALAAALLSLGLLTLAYTLALHLGPWWSSASRTLQAMVLLGYLALALAVNLNYMSLGRYYRDRLMEAFLPDIADAVRKEGIAHTAALANRAPLFRMLGVPGSPSLAPYHLINTNVILATSNIPKFRARGGDNFILSPRFCGSNATGWNRSDRQYSWMTLASAMAISGAAVNPNAGVGGAGPTRSAGISLLMGLLNIRLGYWLENPTPAERRFQLRIKSYAFVQRLLHGVMECCADRAAPNALVPGVLEIFLRSAMDETAKLLQLSDGGHFENLGLYELIRRRLSVIVVCDGSSDPERRFTDLANLMEKVRSDFGARIELDGRAIAGLGAAVKAAGVAAKPTESASGESKTKESRPGEPGTKPYLIARIQYAAAPDNPKAVQMGTLIYIAAGFFDQLTSDLYTYQMANPSFPYESTADQFFDEQQFEAYRELGFQTVAAMNADQAFASIKSRFES